MSLNIPQASQAGLFKNGYNSYDAEDGAVIRNVGNMSDQISIQALTQDRLMPVERSHKQYRHP